LGFFLVKGYHADLSRLPSIQPWGSRVGLCFQKPLINKGFLKG